MNYFPRVLVLTELMASMMLIAACGGSAGEYPSQTSLADPHEAGRAMALAATTISWSKVAAEGESFSVSGTQVIRYGAGSSWIEKSVTGSGQCSNTFFGNDPAYAVVKTCEMQVVGEETAAVAAATTTTPTATATVAPVAAQATSALPSTLGWYQIPNSNLQSVCPPDNYGGTTYAFRSACLGLTEAWSSGVMDTKRNRLIVWGGGHNDYYGNEVYAVNLASQSIERLNNPSVPTNLGQPPIGTLADGKPNSRHTYDGIAYMENVDRMFVFGGAWAASAGTFGSDTWTLNMATLAWQKMNPAGATPRAVPGTVTAYDKNTGLVFLHDDLNLYSYNFSTNTFTKLASNNGITYTTSSVIDPVRKKFVIIGGGQAWVYNIAAGGTYSRSALNTTGGSAIVNSGYPGLAYDPVADRIVAWNGGNTVYSLNLDTNTWTPTTYSGGPGAAINAGTYKRFSYSPASNAFVVVNQMDSNATTLKMR